MEDKIDILLATYKTNIEFLTKQIDSILTQSYTNINLIISDDNSEDIELKEVLENYEKKDERVKVFFQEKNIGYIKNFEFLLTKSDAEYIMFSDHDDIWYPEKVEKSIKELLEENVDCVYVNANQIDKDDKIIHKNYFKYKNVPLIFGKNKLGNSRCIGIGCSQIFTKKIKEKMLPFKESVIAHDWLVSFLANERKGLAYIDEPLFGYRLHETNVFGGRNLDQNLNRWKEEHGNSYKSYLKYRKEKVIDKAYLNGAIMCYEYSRVEENKNFLEKAINYYKNLEESRYINFHFIKYFKFLGGHNLFKKMIKELVIFHFPIIGYIKFR